MARERTSDTSRGEREAPFGERLRRLREAAGLTQEKLPSRADLTAKAISALERGERKRPYSHTVRSLADALELSEEDHASLLAAVSSRGEATAPVPAVAPALPASLTPLLGRERELEEVRSFLREARLLTLTGTGVVGKTRSAEAARVSADLFPDGAAFIGLASLSDPSLVVSTIVQSLGLRAAEGQAPREVLCAHLREKRFLLLLDSFEHVLEAAHEVMALIEVCERLAVLVTSRAPLRVRGEQEYPVQPLALPASTRSPEVEEVAGSPAGRLFVERAQAASLHFALTRENAGAVAAICWRLAGLLLALELVAPRVRLMDPVSLLIRLDRALSTGRARDLPERQRTMRAALDWSHDLLDGPQQVLFRRLSVFAGGFTLEAAETVGAGNSVEAEEVLDLLGELVEQSLAMVEQDAGGARYGMLELVRQYAEELLEGSGEAEEVHRRHASFFLDLTERAQPELRGPRQVEWFDRLETENNNLRAAMGWALEAGEAPTAARMGWTLWPFWWLRDYRDEGHRWMEATLTHELPPALRARAANAAGAMAYTQGDYEASEEFCKESLDSALQAEDALLEGYSWIGLGHTALSCGDLVVAASYLEKALPLFDQTREEEQSSHARVSLGTVFLLQGDADRATPIFEEGLAIGRRIGYGASTYVALYNLAQVDLARGDYEDAASRLKEGVTLSEPLKDQANLAYFLEALAVVAGERGEAGRCARLLGAAEGLLEAVGAPVYSFYLPDRSLYERTVAAVRSRLGESAFEEAYEHGRAMIFEEVGEYALGRENV